MTTAEATLTGARHVLRLDQERAGNPPGGLFFVGDSHPTAVELQPEMWRDLGNPEELTVTIQPGDRHTEVPVWNRPNAAKDNFDPFGKSLEDRLEAIVSIHSSTEFGDWKGATALEAVEYIRKQEERISALERNRA